MAAIAKNIGTRATVALAASGYDASWELRGVRFTGSERAAIDSSSMATADVSSATLKHGNRTYIAGELISPGQLVCDVLWNSNSAPPYYATGTTANDTITVTLPNGDTPGTWVGTGFLVSWEADVPMEEMMTATLTFQFTGEVTITAGM